MISRTHQFALLLTATLLSSCGYTHTFEKPETPAPTAWSDKGDTAWPSASWWKEFKTPALDALMAQAQSDNFDIAAAVARVDEADAQARIAGAPLLPSLEANGGANRQHIPVPSNATSSGRAIQRTTYTATLNASYELDFWGRNWQVHKSALELAKASRFDKEVVELTTEAAIATTYFQVQGLQERLDIATANAANADEVLRVLRQRADVGVAPPLDLAQQESLSASAHAAIPQIRQQLEQNKNALALLAGKLPENVTVEQVALESVALPVVAPGLPSELLLRRPDVQEAEAQLASADADLTAARAAFFPTINLTGEYGFESLALSTLLQPGSKLFTLAGSLTQPIFEGGLLMGAYDLRKARHEELTQNYKKAVLSAFTDVDNALVAVRETGEAEKAQIDTQSTAQRAYDISKIQFDGGIVDITVLLNTQKTLFTARDALVQARLDRINASVGLFKALGGGWRTGAVPPESAPVAEVPPA